MPPLVLLVLALDIVHAGVGVSQIVPGYCVAPSAAACEPTLIADTPLRVAFRLNESVVDATALVFFVPEQDLLRNNASVATVVVNGLAFDNSSFFVAPERAGQVVV